MKLSFHFIFFIICFCALSMNTSAIIIHAPLPVLKKSLDSTMKLVQNVASAMSRVQLHVHAADDDGEEDDRNLNIAISHCADVLGSTYEALNWSISAFHQDPKDYKQNYRTSDVISHTRTSLNANLGTQKTCSEVLGGTKYSIVAERLKQVTTSTHELLSMLQVQQNRQSKARFKFSQPPNFTVSKDGSGNFRKIMDAIAAAPDHSQDYFVIFVKKGVYYENVNIGSRKSNLVIIGEGMDVTTISGSRSFKGGWKTFDSATFAVLADGFIAMDIGFENTAGPEGRQAVALLSSGDRSVFYRCKISGYQDSLLVHAGRQFFQECYISGSVDFIFGYGTGVFQNCIIFVKKNEVGGISVITAHGRFAPNDPSGFSFQFCKIVADSASTNTYLGRPWGKYARTVFMESYMSNAIEPQGWLEYRGSTGIDTLFYGEYMNNGPGAGLAGRVRWPGFHPITEPSEADEFTVAKFIDGNSWLQSTGVKYTQGLGA